MLTQEEVRQVCARMSQELVGTTDEGLWEDVSCVMYRADMISCGDIAIVDRHIDIEYSFGDCYEIREDTPLFYWLCTLWGLPLEEKEIIFYQAECE